MTLGYLLDNVGAGGSTYRGVPINGNDRTEEYVFNPNANNIEKHEYIKLNGVKYYKENNNPSSNTWFSILGERKYSEEKFDWSKTNQMAQKYYKDAKDFTDRVRDKYKLGGLTGENAVNENGDNLKDKLGSYKIFESNPPNTSIEDPNSNFNQQRLAVIRYCIEKNLSIAIANYNDYSGVTANFAMPELREDEWDKIINNISIISFLQGLSIGGKMYNGYSIVTNNKNQEVVNEDSIYIVTNDHYYHRANDNDLLEENKDNISKGVLNIDFERKTSTTDTGQTIYAIPKRWN